MDRPAKLPILLCNLLWFLSCLPGLALFIVAACFPRFFQMRRLRCLLARNAGTSFGRRHGFGGADPLTAFRGLRPAGHEAYGAEIRAICRGDGNVLTRDPVRLLEPTSGSTGGSKLIPYTDALKSEFNAAIHPWIALLYLRSPGLFLGRHYWSISPSTPVSTPDECRVPIGFPRDTDYLGPLQRRIARILVLKPPGIEAIGDPNAFEYLTILSLAREPNLRLISVWHPSFLTILLQRFQRERSRIIADIRHGGATLDVDPAPAERLEIDRRFPPDPERAAAIQAIDDPADLQALWPDLRIISCWDEGRAESGASWLQTAFPRALVQGKGLLATEGVVSIPMGAKKVCAVRSHFLEFEDLEARTIHPVRALTDGRSYSVLVTTGGGFYRYRLGDVVRVEGFLGRTPCLRFLGREGNVSDQVGEKLHGIHVEQVLRKIETACGLRFGFAMVAPHRDGGTVRYLLYFNLIRGAVSDRLAFELETGLRENYHYAHARNLGQLGPAGLFPVAGDAEAAYRSFLVLRGLKPGDIKPTPLHAEAVWRGIFGEP